ncbi:MAG: hypothetical protein J0M09_17195 [Xanthomonadales bacterium]|nr:hypothetical protein [Xanthomonadales bacterium]
MASTPDLYSSSIANFARTHRIINRVLPWRTALPTIAILARTECCATNRKQAFLSLGLAIGETQDDSMQALKGTDMFWPETDVGN